MAEFEQGYCTGCGYLVGRWGHRPYCWRKITMMLDVDATYKRRQRLLVEMNKHWRIRSLFLSKPRHMYYHIAVKTTEQGENDATDEKGQ